MDAYEALLRADMYRVLALGFAHPLPERLDMLRSILQELLTPAYASYVPADIRPQMEALDAALALCSPEALEGEYHHLFATTVAVPPCESSYSFEDKGAILLDVSGFYRAFGLASQRTLESPDSMGHQLEFMSVLALKEALSTQNAHDEAAAIAADAAHLFLQEHLGRWHVLLAERLEAASAQPFYQRLAHLLRQWIGTEVTRFGLTPSPMPRSFTMVEEEEMQCPMAG